MAGTKTSRGLGGLGAVFFLGTLGAIAFYVQRQTVPEQRDLAHKAATMLPDVTDHERPPVLPWEDRLALGSAALVAVRDVGAAPKPKAGDATLPPQPESKDVDPGRARLVQDLNDGHRILLTLDPVLQDSALQIFRNREVPYAAAVVLDLRDNAVLALVGHSSADPNVDLLEIATTPWAPAASTFKLITTASLLETGVVTPATTACFYGGLHGIEDGQLRDDPSRDTRCESLGDAIAHSYNLVIAKLALRHLSSEQLDRTARELLFETKIAFELAVQASPAHIPSEPIERAKVAAGFWNVDMSPLHGAMLASIFARGGIYQPPHIIDQVLGPGGDDLTPARPKPDRVLSKDIAEAIGVMMESTTVRGTARKSFKDKQGNAYIPGMVVAGKTGSLTGKRPPALNYNWFIGFAPASRPEIAFAVLLANEPTWRIKAHYAARRLVQIYVERRDAIARAKDMRLTPDGVILPERMAGVLVNAEPINAPPAQAAGAQTPLPPPPQPSSPPPAPPPTEGELPPVPGPVAPATASD